MSRLLTTNKKNREETILTHVQQVVLKHGGRMGRARMQIVKTLIHSPRPLPIQEISKRVCADEVSVYRTIATLMKMGLIEEIQLTDGSRAFTLATEHHDHVVCTQCGFVAHIPCVTTLQESIRTATAFKIITAHVLTYYGVCGKCAL